MRNAANWDPEKSLEKLRRYCAYQERCRSELLAKMRQLGCHAADTGEVLETLALEGYWNEARYARSYARGRFSQKSWGRIKIRQGLLAKQVESDLIGPALEEIDEVLYSQTLRQLAEKKLSSFENRDWETIQKVKAWLWAKGYEEPLIGAILEGIE